MGAPRHPGPRPPGFSYPFAEAGRAREATREAGYRLQAMVRVHRLSLASALVGFEGRTRVGFEQGIRAVLDRCEAHAQALLCQAELLDHEFAVARRREEQAVEAQTRWRRELDRWSAAQREATLR
jgi:hypothetical protein